MSGVSLHRQRRSIEPSAREELAAHVRKLPQVLCSDGLRLSALPQTLPDPNSEPPVFWSDRYRLRREELIKHLQDSPHTKEVYKQLAFFAVDPLSPTTLTNPFYPEFCRLDATRKSHLQSSFRRTYIDKSEIPHQATIGQHCITVAMVGRLLAQALLAQGRLDEDFCCRIEAECLAHDAHKLAELLHRDAEFLRLVEPGSYLNTFSRVVEANGVGRNILIGDLSWGRGFGYLAVSKFLKRLPTGELTLALDLKEDSNLVLAVCQTADNLVAETTIVSPVGRVLRQKPYAAYPSLLATGFVTSGDKLVHTRNIDHLSPDTLVGNVFETELALNRALAHELGVMLGLAGPDNPDDALPSFVARSIGVQS